MENIIDKKAAKKFLIYLSMLFLMCELLFALAVVQYGNGELLGVAFKSLFFTPFIYFLYKGHSWSKWVLSILLILYAALCLVAGYEHSSLMLKIIGVYYLYFGAILHFSRQLKVLTHKNTSVLPEFSSPTEGINIHAGGDSFVVQGQEYEYPRLVTRLQAMFIDGMIILFTMVFLAAALGDMENKSPIILSVLGLITLAYEPLLTSYSATIGQRLLKIRVRDIKNPEQPIPLFKSYLRYFVKGLLGWISFISIHSNPEHRAIHDFAGDCVMIKLQAKRHLVVEASGA